MMRRIRPRRFFLLSAALTVLLFLADPSLQAQTSGQDAEVYRVNRRSQWQQWTFPVGTLELGRTGTLTPAEFKGSHNAATNAGEFTHALVGGSEVRGGAWKAGSNLAMAGNIHDGDPETYWQPDPEAPLAEWWVEIDLGRAVMVTEIRLVFPDQEGARPFQEFRVFGSEGRRVTRSDVFSFHLIGGTTRPIEETLVTYDVDPLVREARRVLDDGDGLGTTEVDRIATYDLLQYIRVLVDAKTADAALAEIEVYTPGENIALQTLQRGGTIQERAGRGFAFKMADGDANTDWGARRERNQDPIAWDWDLGALFWINRVVMRTSDFLLSTLTYGSNLPQIRTHGLSVSDGSRTLTGAVDYEEIFVGDPDALLLSSAEFPGQVSYLFSPRPVRFLAAAWIGGGNETSFAHQSGFLVETLIYPVGHVARVELSSDFINLGQIAGDDRVKVIKALSWEADLPPGAYIQARTRSGNTLQENNRYFRKDGQEVTAEQYEQMVKVLRGDILTFIGVGEDWSEWSNFYQRSGEQFLSPSPRRFVQIQLILGSDRPSTAPTVSSLSLEFTDAFLAGVSGEIQPRTAEPGVAQLFSYRIVPLPDARDRGFDRILVQTPSPADSRDLELRIGESATEPEIVQISGDSLLVELSRPVRSEEVELIFSSVLRSNGTQIKAFVGSKRQPGIWQPVDPVSRLATTVFLPSVPGSNRVIANVVVQPMISPNGDGVGDVGEIRFHVLKVNTEPEVRIYSLDGRLIRELDGQLQADQSYLYTWSGLDRTSRLVPPGAYLCGIRVGAQVGSDNVLRVVNVAY